MNKDDLKIGIIKESELVNLFGTDSQKKSYLKNGKFISSYKVALFKQVNKYCEIKKVNKRNSKENLYKITKIYNYPLPVNYDKMQKSIYKYMIPLILYTLVCNQCDIGHAMEISINKWAKKIGMINKNYNFIKYNNEDNKIKRKIPINVMNEFYDKTDNMINYYLTNTLDYLKVAEMIVWKQSCKVLIEELDETTRMDCNNNIIVNINFHTRSATQDDRDYLSQCLAIADEEADIINASERYYSKKTQKFQTVLKRELYKKKIKRIYYTCEAYYTNLNKCNELLSHFDNVNSAEMTKDFNKAFSDMIIKNAGNRFEKNAEKYSKIAETKEEYQSLFKSLCETTVNHSTEYLGEKNREQDNDEDYNLIITHTRSYDNEFE